MVEMVMMKTNEGRGGDCNLEDLGRGEQEEGEVLVVERKRNNSLDLQKWEKLLMRI